MPEAVDIVAESPLPYALRSHCCAWEAQEPARVGGVAARGVRGRAALKAIGENNFAKGAQWSPDGSTVLAGHDDGALRLYRLPANSKKIAENGTPGDAPPSHLEPYCHAIAGGPILDFCFFPGYSLDVPATCCFLTSSQGHPIHLREAAAGTLRNTYRPFSHVDEVCHAFSLCFSSDGRRIVAGFEQYLRVFDVQRPGRQVEDWLLSTRKGKGQKGIIGAVAASSESPGVYAAGSYSRSVGVYHQGSKGKPIASFVDTEDGYEMGGVTQLAWVNEWLLLSGHRKDRWIRAWDLRMAGKPGALREAAGVRSQALMHRFPRPAQTQQRFSFSVDGDVLATGTDSGDAICYSLSTTREVGRIAGAHRRPCISAMLHPGSSGMLLTASGARCFPDYDVDSPTSSRSPTPEPPEKRRRGGNRAAASAKEARALNEPLDNSLRIWRLVWE
eukprot:CAMPEP_0117550302 /NCGR_PEP_ID=MMETSP0784-20121206/48611_1 /TAXON_ID=39447 /ORGANISM="" /LENGTH=443 /DNA_ID=CAMNT_0005347317 /DNA_START=170 /DNA_END=1498 /DNA_ORIENTATION=+